MGPGTLKAFVNAEVVEVPPAAKTKSIWSFITKSEDTGANVATVDPGALRDKVTPLLKTSDTWAWPLPVVLPESAKNASPMKGTPKTL